MENLDVLRQIAVHLDNDALFKLSYTQFWDGLKTLLHDNLFWYERCNYITKRELTFVPEYEWRRIYTTLVTMSKFEVDTEHGLDYLPSLLVLIELSGEPKWNKKQQGNIWENINNSEVLDYLLERGYLEYRVWDALDSLNESAKRGNIDMVSSLLPTITESLDNEDGEADWKIVEGIMTALRSTTERQHLDVVELLIDILLSYNLPGEDYVYLLSSALKTGNVEIIKHLIESIGKVYTQFDKVLESACKRAETGLPYSVLEFVVDEYKIGEKFSSLLFLLAVKGGDADVIALLVERGLVDIEPDTWIDILADSVISNVPDLISYVLTQIVPDILALLKKIESWVGKRRLIESGMTALLSDERIKIEEMDTETIRQIWSFNSDLESDTVRGFVIGGVAAGGPFASREQVGRRIEESTLLRFIVFKRPTSSELMSWIIKRQDRTTVEAARSVLEDRVIMEPIRALLLCILYPTLSLQDLISDLRMEEVEESKIIEAAQLVGAYLGESGMRARG